MCLMFRLHQVLVVILATVVNGFLLTMLVAQGISPKAIRALAKWPKLEAEKVTLLPLSPVPRPPTIKEEMHGTRGWTPGGPAMAVVRQQRIYVVDDVKQKLLECSMEGQVLRRLPFPKSAPKSLSGAMSLCGNVLWVGFEGVPYAFAVDIDSWSVIEERRWKGKGVVAGLFAMSDRTLYVIMPGKKVKYDVIWQLIKVEPDGKQQRQMVEGWRPSYVDANEGIYWTNYGSQLFKTANMSYSKFGEPLRLVAEIHSEDFATRSIRWKFGSPIIGQVKGTILGYISFWTRISEQGGEVSTSMFLEIQKGGRIKITGLEPLLGHGKPVRSLYLPKWWVCEGQIYSIVREDVGEHSRFWLVRLKL